MKRIQQSHPLSWFVLVVTVYITSTYLMTLVYIDMTVAVLGNSLRAPQCDAV